MKGTLLPIVGGIILVISAHAVATTRIIHCPAVNIHHYGKNLYYDPKIQRVWHLNWLNRQKPVWNQTSIPQTTTCGLGKSSNGIPLRFQCAVFQCKSDALIASLGERSRGLKCFSAYVSTRNTFYCDSFSLN